MRDPRSRLVTVLAAVSACLLTTPLHAAAITDWPIYHIDPQHHGDDAQPPLATATQQWTSPALDGAVYAEPITRANRILVATENDSVYALDATTGQIIWYDHLQTPRTSNFPCGDINPLGITGTPVIDGNTLFTVEEVQKSPTDFHFVLVALNVIDGSVLWWYDITPPGMQPDYQQQRAALALSQGRVIVNFGGLYGDCGQYWGYVVSFPESGSGTLDWWRVPTAREGGIWAPPGPMVDSSGLIYVAVGNGSAHAPPYDGSDSVTRLTPDMQVVDWFAPSTWASDNANDLDLGSVSPILVAGGAAVFQAGKTGTGYLLNSQALGGIGGQLFSAPVCSGEVSGGTAFDGSVVYLSCFSGVTAIRIDSATHFTVLWHTSSGAVGPPILSGGLLWSTDWNGGHLFGLDPGSGSPLVTIPVSGLQHFVTPTTSAGRLLLAAGNSVQAWAPPVIAAPPGAGWTLDGWGAVHQYGGAQPVGFSSYIPGLDVFRGLVLRPDRESGYVLDASGLIWPWGRSAPTEPISAYWPTYPIARALLLNPCDANGNSGWVLDGWGGLHPFGSAPAVTQETHYWAGFDIARAVAANSCSGGHASGYVLDGWGGVHPWWEVGQPALAVPAQGGYWPGYDIARGLVVTAGGQGYLLDGWGNMHAFGGAPAPVTHGEWLGHDTARALTWVPSLQGGIVLDDWGGCHAWWQSGAPGFSGPSDCAYWPGFDIARGIAG